MRYFRFVLLIIVASIMSGCGSHTEASSPCQDSTYLSLLHKPAPLTDSEAVVFLRLSHACEAHQPKISDWVYIIGGAALLTASLLVIAALNWASHQAGHPR